MTSLFQTQAAGPGPTAAITASQSTGQAFNQLGAFPSSGGFSLSQLFTQDTLRGSSQDVPFIGPIVSVFQAFNDERDARNSAARLDFNARAEELVGKAQTVSALRVLNEVQANNVVAAFTSGGGLAGSRGRVIQDINRDAALAFTLIRTNAEIKAGDLRQKARIIRKVARFDRNVAIGKSLFTFGASAVGAAS